MADAAMKWKKAYETLAESMHQLLLVFESRLQPDALRYSKDGNEVLSV